MCVLIACALFAAFTLTYGVHEHSVSHACVFCHLDHSSYAGAAQAPQVAPHVVRQLRPVLEQAGHAVDRGASTSSGRAPPANRCS